MTQNSKKNALSKKQYKYWKQIISMAVEAVLSEPGSTQLDHFEKIHRMVMAANKKHPLQKSDDEIAHQQHVEIEKLISTLLGRNSRSAATTFKFVFLVDDVRSVAHYAGDIVECRNIIKYETGILSVSKLYQPAMIVSNWIALDLLIYCWNDCVPYCPDMLGMLLSIVHSNGGFDGGCIEHFGIQTTVNMFETASPEGIRCFTPSVKNLNKPVRAYRACSTFTPKEAASGMTWTLDPDRAIEWASAHRIDDDVSPIVCSIMIPEEVLATFERDQGLVVYPNPSRQFHVLPSVTNSENETIALEDV